MAGDPQGLALFGGITTVISADYTMSHGITPGVCTLVAAPQPGLETAVGPLVFTFGKARVELPDCKIVTHVFRQDGEGQRWYLSIHDRRWKWAFGQVIGSYNLRFDSGDLDPDREQDPQFLAGLCLYAMGEDRWDVSQMPNDQRPLVEWDRVLPAQALAELAERLGCRVVLGLDNLVHVAPTGVGAQLPKDAVAEASPSIKIPDIPQRLIVSCGKTRFQGDFLIEPVGQERDGSIQLIDNLSYKPRGGWQTAQHPNFDAVTDPNDRELARLSVYRWFRINGMRDGSDLNIPGYGPIANGFQLLPIEDRQVQTYEDMGVKPPPGAPANAKNEHPLPAQVFGTFWTGEQDFVNTRANTPYRGKYRVNRDTAVVEFDEWVVKIVEAADGSVSGETAPDLFLRTAVSIRDSATWAWDRYERSREIGTVKTPPRILKHDEIVLSYYAVYSARGKVLSVRSNQVEMDREADYYLDAAQREYRIDTPEEVGYGGIKPISPDGAIQQVSWHVGAPHASTRAGRNNEFSIVVPSYQQRRRTEQLRVLIDQQNQQNPPQNPGLV